MTDKIDGLRKQLSETRRLLNAEIRKNAGLKRQLRISRENAGIPRFLHDIHGLLLNASDKPSVIRRALKKLGTVLNADRCCILSLSHDKKAFSNVFEWTASPELAVTEKIGNVRPEKFSGFIRAMTGGHNVIVEDVCAPSEYRDDLKSVPHLRRLRSFFLAGLYRQRELIGILGVDFMPPGKKFGAFEREILTGFAELMGLFLSRLYSRQVLSMAVSAMPAMLFVKDADAGFRYIFGNPCFADFLHTTPSKLPGKDAGELFRHAPGVGERILREDLAVIEGRRKRVFPADSPAPDGTVFYQNTVKYPLQTWDGRNLLAGFSTDISEMHLSKVREKCYSGIMDALSRDMELKEVFDVLFSTIIDNIPWCGRLVFMRPDPKERYEIVYEKLTGEEYRLPRNIFIRFRNSLGDELRKLSPSETFFCRDLPRRLPEISDYPYHSCAAVPVYAGKKLQGYVIFFSNVVYRHTGAMKTFLRLLRETTSIMFQRFQAKEQLKNAEYFNSMLLKSIQLPIFVYNPEGRLVKVNEAAESIGMRLSRKTFPFKRAPGDKEEAPNVVEEVLRTGKNLVSAGFLGDKCYRLRCHPVFSIDGTIHSIVCCAEDITGLQLKINNMQKVNAFLDFLLTEADMLSAISKIIPGWGRHLHADWCCLVSYVPGKPLLKCEYQYAARGSSKIFPEGSRIRFDSNATGPECFRDTEFIRVEHCEGHVFKDELVRIAEDKKDVARLSSFYTHSVRKRDKVWGVLAIGFKKTRILTPEEEEFCSAGARCVELMLIQNTYREKLKQAVLDVQKMEQAKSLFSASMIHEIRTPLNAVIGFADVLQNDSLDPEERKEYLRSISAAGNALMSLINDILDLSKLASAQMSIAPSLINMEELIADCKNIFQERCRAKSIVMNTAVEREIPLLLLDQNRIRQILFNLLGNAVKFTDGGSITITCAFRPVMKNSGTLTFAVSDTGIGIAKKDQKDIFGLFSQVLGIRGTRASSGTGIGLALCKRLVDKMNGRILLQSSPGSGSTFTVVLPKITFLRKQPSRQLAEKNDSPRLPPETKVMIVDDVPLNLKVLSAMFRRSGIQVIEASGGEEAIAMLEKEPVDSVLTDLWMPRMNGAELAAAIRNKPECRHIRIAALTADVDLSSNFDMDVFDAVLQKPVEFPKVVEFLKGGVPDSRSAGQGN